MNFVYAALAIIVTLVVLKFLLKLSLKIFSTIFIIIAVIVTVAIMIMQPAMHKKFSFNVIEKVLKINADGSTSIVETTTINEVKKEKK